MTPESMRVPFDPPVKVAYNQTPFERTKIAPTGYQRRQLWFSLLYSAFIGAEAAIHISRSGLDTMSGFLLGGLALYLAALGTSIALSIGNPWSGGKSFELTFRTDGLLGTVDGRAISLKWTSISGARDAGDAIVINRRELPCFAIPKDALADAPAFWNMLGNKMIAKRGLIASPTLRTFIVNSAAR